MSPSHALRTRSSLLLSVVVAGIAACGVSTGETDAPGVQDQATIARPQYANCKKYSKLSETGLYALDKSGAMTSELGEGVEEFRPAYEFWSDGAKKKRWIALPPGTTIDTRDMDHWVFPKGTKLWKELARDGQRVETRLIEIGCDADPAHPETGSGEYFLGAFAWNAEGTDADLAPNGGPRGIPSQDACTRCHGSEPGGILGFSALQLSEPDLPMTVSALAAQGRLSNPPPAGTTYRVPGDAISKPALGYFHANCGYCHTEGGRAFFVNDQQLRLSIADTQKNDPSETSVFQSIVGRKAQGFIDEGWVRVVPGDPEKSFVFHRMTSTERRMPPGRVDVDTEGVAIVKAWIESLH